MTRCQIIPPYLLERIATSALEADPSHTLEVDARLRRLRATAHAAGGALAPTAAGDAPFTVHTADNGVELPGRAMRSAGAPATGDPAVDEAYVGVEATLALLSEVYGRHSYDGRGAPVIATVHYERDYDNAFWDGWQLVLGDGDGQVFERFTKPVDVLAHELGHAVTQATANLTYHGQAGALNESVSDVLGACLKQRLRGESAADADWLIGEGIFLPSVRGRALRSMKEPGTAYDDPALGRDPQVATMDDFVETADDNGGVHTNSGIPNRAFHLAAVGVGGTTWAGAGRIWYAALTSGVPADTDFAGFATATVQAAAAVSPEAQRAVARAWADVGVAPAGGASSPPVPPEAASPSGKVAVTRSGGVANLRVSGKVILGDDPRTREVETLIGRIDFRAVAGSSPQPDRFVYTFHVPGLEVVVGEPDLTPELQQLVRLLLG